MPLFQEPFEIPRGQSNRNNNDPERGGPRSGEIGLQNFFNQVPTRYTINIFSVILMKRNSLIGSWRYLILKLKISLASYSAFSRFKR